MAAQLMARNAVRRIATIKSQGQPDGKFKANATR